MNAAKYEVLEEKLRPGRWFTFQVTIHDNDLKHTAKMALERLQDKSLSHCYYILAILSEV